MGGGGLRVLLDIFHWEIFADLYQETGGKEERGKKGKWRVKEGKFEREEVEKLKMEGEKVWKWGEDFLIYLFIIFLFYFIFFYFLFFFLLVSFWNH